MQDALRAGYLEAAEHGQPGGEPDVEDQPEVALERLLGAGELAVGGPDQQAAGVPFQRRHDQRTGDVFDVNTGGAAGFNGVRTTGTRSLVRNDR